jgi:hypothetical protein
MKNKWKITNHHLFRNDIAVAFFTQEGEIYTLRGWFGEVYGSGDTRMEATKIATKDPRIGKVPAGAVR